jgi:hypothetical protein
MEINPKHTHTPKKKDKRILLSLEGQGHYTHLYSKFLFFTCICHSCLHLPSLTISLLSFTHLQGYEKTNFHVHVMYIKQINNLHLSSLST